MFVLYEGIAIFAKSCPALNPNSFQCYIKCYYGNWVNGISETIDDVELIYVLGRTNVARLYS